MSQYLSNKFEDLDKISKEYSNVFQSNKPFPFINFKNFFNEQYLNSILDNFSDLANTKKKLTNLIHLEIKKNL